jgi:polar amino acid transport system permease protein
MVSHATIDAERVALPSPALILPPSRPGRWVGMAVMALGVAWIIYQVFVNPGFEWYTVGSYMLQPTILEGVLMTVKLTGIIMIVAILIGVVVAVMRLSDDPILGLVGHAFIWFFRGTPVLVQLVFWYNLASLFPMIQLGVPFGGPKFYEISSTTAISSLTAAILGFGLNEAAYMAEIIRGGILSVDQGQVQAGKALGYTSAQRFRIIILPQAMRAIVPPTGK